MSSSKSGGSQAAIRYAKALFELAKGADLEAIEKDLVALKALVKSNENLDVLIHSPLISRTDKETALVAVLKSAKSQTLTQQFVAVLARNNRLPLINAIVTAFINRLMEHRGEVVADITSAVLLEQKHIDSVSASLSEALGKKVSVHATVDSTILGGLKIKIGSVLLDNSLKSKMDRLEQATNNVSLAQAA